MPHHHQLQIAPMVDWTNSPFRLLMRLMLPYAKLYSEMLVPQAIIRHPNRYLDYHELEHPLVLQLGGSDPDELVSAAIMAQIHGYDEINLNLGCPSERVQAGRFGACLMKEKDLVLQCFVALKNALTIPVTAKLRIGVDEFDSYAYFEDFAGSLITAGCDELIIHARKAWLKGLNPKQNRTVPPINFDYIAKLHDNFPDTRLIANGDIKTLVQAQSLMGFSSGVMLGRLACDNPMGIQDFHQHFFPDRQLLKQEEIVSRYVLMIEKEAASSQSIGRFMKPLYNLYHGTILAKKWKACLQAALLKKNLNMIKDFIDNLVPDIS
ncbi:MAG: tRNA dihydrouridine(20/20a) synthase DusA [Gammaproteobacteria bacterium]|nr:tRNA dihydrouridine(20/20a) synthase DusA [Gammaproteobacteria bacterium]